jgi:penicillin-binding protein 1C
MKSEAVLLDRHGSVIHELRIDPKGRRLDWVGLKEISPSMIRTVIYSEDRSYYEHHGVDWKSAASALVNNLFKQTRRGASTITMQLATLLDKKPRPVKSRKTLDQKWDQIKAAQEIEKQWTKDNILEAYLNLVSYRGELQGISAGSRGLFGKEPHGLNEEEALLLAALIRSPNASAEVVGRRACALGNSLKSDCRCGEIKNLAQKIFASPYVVRQEISLAPHAARILIRQGVRSIISTLDSRLQSYATEVLTHHLMAVKSQNVHDGAVLIVENRTGDVLAYVGGAGKESSAEHVDGVRSRRQAGSTLKPFLYAAAFERKILTPASMINDSPFEIATATGIYKPANYDNDFKGAVPVRTALASSLNIPAVRTLTLVGLDFFIQRLRQLGFSRLESDDYYGPSLALGSADVSLWELTNAYRTLANAGLWSGMRLTPEKKKTEHLRALAENSVFLISDILSDREARSSTFSLENPLSTRFWSAVKTGTSKDMRDNWCIGYSSKYTVGVWVGNFGGRPMWHISGITGAAPVWIEIMNHLHKNVASVRPRPPSGVVARRAALSGTEWFIQGTEPLDTFKAQQKENLTSGYKDPHIIYPVKGTIIALDPDIPEENQRIFFEAVNDSNWLDWSLNDEKIGRSDMQVSWKPKKGTYTLSLIDKDRRIMDSVKFEVRGEATNGLQ